MILSGQQVATRDAQVTRGSKLHHDPAVKLCIQGHVYICVRQRVLPALDGRYGVRRIAQIFIMIRLLETISMNRKQASMSISLNHTQNPNTHLRWVKNKAQTSGGNRTQLSKNLPRRE